MHSPSFLPSLRRGTFILAMATLSFGSAVRAAEPASAPDSASAFPSRTITLISGFAPGGATDVVARLLARQLSQELKANVIVDNKPGASGNLGAAYVAKAPADGYTMYLTNAVVSMPSLFKDLRYDINKDLSPLALIGYGPLVLIANPKAPVKSMKDLIEYGSANKGKLDYGSGGVGSINHMTMELLIARTGINLHHIPYKGGGPATAAVLSGEVPLAVSSIPEVVAHVRQGTLVPLAISTRVRSPALPNVPTVAETGVPGYDSSSWYGILVPSATPRPIQEKLTRALATSMQNKGLRDSLTNLGIVLPETGSAAEFKELLAREIDKWAKVIEKERIVAQ
ncbi:MAG: tripartite tricarboxylate transporter substrate binding protein [Ramlibacter sp.]|jgi:tripartite-type tricarboxylate transporter receptor subunit TctC|uniref:Bug family tripartite tricarboxylate transporter substrate binding protein n=1 Tax=Ramlibacter sp. TaxID=1917967 RepID=UPI0026119111|nr:tripartite tricarboxylate transporter substrate binding protein [Ramlibacter sp.]MDH4378163.1 tripartite tricarboxylate transporter substrate binding protein [Ramlibacter sp.]